MQAQRRRRNSQSLEFVFDLCGILSQMNNQPDSIRPKPPKPIMIPHRISLSERSMQHFRLSIEAQTIIITLAKKLGVGRTHVLELAVRDMAKREEIKF
jgi:hypothetical protein